MRYEHFQAHDSERPSRHSPYLRVVNAVLMQAANDIRYLRAKLQQHKPGTLGQAARISGVTPAALSALLGHVKKRRRAGLDAAE